MNRCSRVVWHAIIALVVSGTFSVPAEAQSIGASMVSFLNGKLNSRVGGGESSHMATEALRVGGGEFYPDDLGADFPGTGDKVWGTLVKVISYDNGTWSDSSPDNPCLPGDVIQFGGNAVIGAVAYPANFTAVVQSVNSSGRPSAVFQQNLAGVRTVQSAVIHTKQLTAGWLRIYRPVTRIDEVGTWKFTVVNNVASSKVYTIMIDIDTISTVTATGANTAGSYFVHKITNDTIVPCVVNDDNTVYVETSKGNEICNLDDGSVGLQQLAQ